MDDYMNDALEIQLCRLGHSSMTVRSQIQNISSFSERSGMLENQSVNCNDSSRGDGL